MDTRSIVLLVILAVPLLIFIILLFLIGQFFNLYIQAMLSNARVSMFDMIGMRFRRVDTKTIVYSHIRSVKAGMPIPVRTLEVHHLAGGHIPRVVSALIAARKGNIDLDWDRASAIDLAGRDILNLVQTSIHPFMVDLPARGQPPLQTSTGDGTRINIRARIALATNLERLIGGIPQDMLLARIEDAISTAIANTPTGADLDLEAIAASLMSQNLDRGAGTDIVAIDLILTHDNLAPTA